MAKQKFVGEYPINASRKMLFPYLSTATGLCQWFADDVNINNIDKTLIFIVDGEERVAVIDSIKNNRYVRFRFLNEDEKPKENDTLEFRLEINELTQEVFVRVEEFTESDDLDESYQIWDNLLAQLKEIIGA
ncbi:MAG: START-like domain-containing protein [Bacteroidota bacterium]|nr:START-like domain-containing protein [Bacteroidota bacterium]|tara:strand:- start:1933 stop:2328 length:396 start_codon:yes stop_codon:yes gene_type:complete